MLDVHILDLLMIAMAASTNIADMTVFICQMWRLDYCHPLDFISCAIFDFVCRNALVSPGDKVWYRIISRCLSSSVINSGKCRHILYAAYMLKHLIEHDSHSELIFDKQ